MKKLMIIFCILLLFGACKKDCLNLCTKNIEENIILDTHFNEISCWEGEPSANFTRFYKNETDFKNDTTCYNQPIPVELGFNGIVLAQGVKVSYVSEDENNSPAYAKAVEIRKDSCDKIIDFHFILKTESQFEEFEHNENVIVLLNGVDASYTVNFSHEIIPFGE